MRFLPVSSMLARKWSRVGSVSMPAFTAVRTAQVWTGPRVLSYASLTAWRRGQLGWSTMLRNICSQHVAAKINATTLCTQALSQRDHTSHCLYI